MITLTEKEVKGLTEYALNLPTKYGMGLVDFLNKKTAEVNQKVEEVVVEEVK